MGRSQKCLGQRSYDTCGIRSRLGLYINRFHDQSLCPYGPNGSMTMFQSRSQPSQISSSKIDFSVILISTSVEPIVFIPEILTPFPFPLASGESRTVVGVPKV